jgi:hypothetical protein
MHFDISDHLYPHAFLKCGTIYKSWAHQKLWIDEILRSQQVTPNIAFSLKVAIDDFTWWLKVAMC